MAHADLSCTRFRHAEGFYTSEVQCPERWPVRTFLPTGYEPNYPYPLLVFFHGQGGSEEQVLRLAPRLSRRNYICIGLRGPVPGETSDGKPAYGWGPDEAVSPTIEEYVIRAVQQTRRSYHVHSERVYLAGFGEGGTLAYRLGLLSPERFAGIISLNGLLPRRSRPLFRLDEIRSLRILIGHGRDNALAPLAEAHADYRLLYTAGLSVSMHTYATDQRLHLDMLRDVNRWVMGHVNA